MRLERIGTIATREFLATVLTRGFVFGVLLFPVLTVITLAIGPRLINQRGAPVRGQMAIVDPTGLVTSELRTALAPGAIAARRDDAARRAIAAAPAAVRDLTGSSSAPTSNATVERLVGAVPDLRLVERAPETADPADLRSHKAWLTDTDGGERRIALVVVHPDAVRLPAGDAEYGSYDLYVLPNLDDRVETVIFDSLHAAIVNARARQQHLDRGQLDTLLRVTHPPSITVTNGNERVTSGAFNRILPFVFCGLLLMSVLMGSQGLITSTIEEKSSRVIEVLLSAVSPLELLAGKIIGQFGVSFVILSIYVALAFVGLFSFAVFDLLDLTLVVYLFIFFVITYLTIGAAMVAVGSAVNEMREAQHLMMPIILVMMVPWVLAAPIAREPNSTFSTAISFIPPVNTFAMLLRMTSSAPPPMWQVWVTIAVGVAGVAGAVWCAAKIFTIGLLMYGKPPDFKTLIRWVRQA
jgi:ABC-2 type transport system permease protein